MSDNTVPVLESKNQGSIGAARPPLPPFTRETATLKVRLAEDGWNSRDPEKVPLRRYKEVYCLRHLFPRMSRCHEKRI